MTTVLGSRRRAEEFNILVESLADGSASDSDARYADALELVGALRTVEAPALRPEFSATLREQLMVEADTALVSSPADRLALTPRRTKRERRIAALVGSAAIVGASTSVALAAQSALPGDVLYPVKRAIENAHAGLSLSDETRGETLLASASGRLEEVSALSRSDDVDAAAAISDTLDDFTKQASEASDVLLDDYTRTGDEQSVVRVREFAASSIQTLSRLQEHLPATARDAVVHAARVLTRIDDTAERLCPQCGGGGITDIPANLFRAAVPRVRVPPAVGAPSIKATDDRSSDRAGDRRHGDRSSPGTGTSTTIPLPSIQTSAPSPDDEGGKSTKGGGDQDNPVGDILGGLTGGGSDKPASKPSGTGLPLPEPGDLTTGLVDPLKQP